MGCDVLVDGMHVLGFVGGGGGGAGGRREGGEHGDGGGCGGVGEVRFAGREEVGRPRDGRVCRAGALGKN